MFRLADLRPGSSVLEIGPGTGQATRHLAAQGLEVLAVELGAGLADRARANFAHASNVEVVTSAFESWDPGGRTFDAVFACNSFHWVDPSARFVKSASVLPPGGRLVLVATPWAIPLDADSFWWEVQAEYEACGGEFLDPASLHPDRLPDMSGAVRASGLFADPVVVRHPFTVTFSAEDYAANLSTQSGIKRFPEPARSDLIRRIRRRINKRGGQLTTHLVAITIVAQKI
jgi:SAM-dependent methyltransferase